MPDSNILLSNLEDRLKETEAELEKARSEQLRIGKLVDTLMGDQIAYRGAISAERRKQGIPDEENVIGQLLPNQSKGKFRGFLDDVSLSQAAVILEVVKGSGMVGVTSGDIVKALEALRPDITSAYIYAALSRAKKEGKLITDGERFYSPEFRS